VCAKLDSCGSERVLDIGCGCGSFAIHAAREHGVLRHRNHDYGDLADESCDASIGMVEHVGSANIDVLDYARSLSGWARQTSTSTPSAANRWPARSACEPGDCTVRGFENRFTSIFRILADRPC
jgi:cyclopropane fatty-acyl-phospholipid synthase-like methyltransferase